MDEKVATSHGRTGGALSVLAIWIGMAILGGGCATRHFTPANLPDQYVVSPSPNMTSFPLSRLATVAVSTELVDRGDVLDVTIVTDSSEVPPVTSTVRVEEDGYARVPPVGAVPLAGLELAGAEQAIASAAVRNQVFRNPHVMVTMKHQRKNRVTVVGAVKNPGVIELPRGSSTLLAAMVATGGFVPEADATIEIRQPAMTQLGQERSAAGVSNRPDKVTLASYQSTVAPTSSVPTSSSRIDLFQLDPQAAGQLLGDGSVVVVGKRESRRIHVIGLVNKPGQYEIPADQDLFLLDALALAGGRTMEFADNVLIIRRGADGSPVRIDVSVSQAKSNVADNMRLAAGDVISVEQTFVTGVVDSVRTFFRVGFSSALPLF